jgi:hypothetical protein
MLLRIRCLGGKCKNCGLTRYGMGAENAVLGRKNAFWGRFWERENGVFGAFEPRMVRYE